MLKNFYLYRLYKTNKLWFIFFLIFITGSLITHKTGVEITPFFIWGMYSEKDSVKPAYEILEVTINGNEKLKLDRTFEEPYRMMIYTSFDKYKKYIKAGNIDSLQFFRQGEKSSIHQIQHFFAGKTFNTTESINQYPAWLKRYISSVIGNPVNSISVDNLVFTYNDNGYATLISKTNFLRQ